MSKTRLYNVWNTMLSRCYNKNVTKYKSYGERGVGVCDSWHNFESFYQWAIATGYDEDAEYGICTLDRIDVNGDYSPENCRWATAKEQANNTRFNRFLEFDGEKNTISQWSDIVGIKASVISDRINSGWAIKDALTKPLKNIK